MDDRLHQQALGIDKDMALLALDLRPGVAAHREAWSAPCSNTIRTAGEPISAEYRFDVFDFSIARTSQGLEPPASPARFNHAPDHRLLLAIESFLFAGAPAASAAGPTIMADAQAAQ